MDFLLQLVRWEILIFLLGLAGVVVFQLLNGRINTQNLLYGRISSPDGSEKSNVGSNDSDLYFSPERVQLLVFTLGAALYYLMQTMTTAKSGKFPDIPETWPALMGGSNAIYLGGKAYARWFASNAPK
jgi:hypothetical protein